MCSEKAALSPHCPPPFLLGYSRASTQCPARNNIVKFFLTLPTLRGGTIEGRAGLVGDWALSLLHSMFWVRQELRRWGGEVSDFISFPLK